MKTLKILFVTFALALTASAHAQDYVSTPVTLSTEKVRMSGKLYYSHVVLERQTLFSIAKAYGVSIEDIYAANPTLEKSGLQKNSIILIPLVEKQEVPAETAHVEQASEPETETALPPGEYIEHTAKWFETLDDIAKTYGVSAKEIMAINGMKSKKLSKRQVLKIPVRSTPEADLPQETISQTDSLTVAPAEETPGVEEPVPDFTVRHEIIASLLLPLNASATPSNSAMDFYSGALLAVKDLKEKDGITVNLNVHDYPSIPSEYILGESDFVLGPFSAAHFKTLTDQTGGRITLISPLDQRSLSFASSVRNFIQVPTPSKVQFEDLANWVGEELSPSDIVLVIKEKNAKNPAAQNAIEKRLDSLGISYGKVEYAIVEGRGIPSILTEKLIKGSMNRIIVASESEAFVSDAMRNIGIMLGKNFPVTAYATSKVRSFDTIDTGLYHDASLHVSTAYFTDYNSAEVSRFVKRYRALYNMEPSRFALQGYDTMTYFARISSMYGPSWKMKLSSEKASLLHTSFDFSAENGSFVNQAVRRIIYNPDNTTTLVK